MHQVEPFAFLERLVFSGSEELGHTKKVLGAAALTYVAALAATVLQLARLVFLFGGRRQND